MSKRNNSKARSLKNHPEFKNFWNSGIGVLIIKLSTKSEHWHKKTIRLWQDDFLIDNEGYLIVGGVLDYDRFDPDDIIENYDFQPKEIQAEIINALSKIVNEKLERALAQANRLNAEIFSSITVFLKS